MPPIDVDLDAAAEAFAAGDAARLAIETAPLGLALDLDAMTATLYARDVDRRRLGKLVLVAIHHALASDAGLALERDDGGIGDRHVAIAVRVDDRVVAGVTWCSNRPGSRYGWKTITRWYKDAPRNRETLIAWARGNPAGTCSIAVRAVTSPRPDARGDELLAAVLATPDDDAPRLVLADWLIERGDPRGELIHLECTPSPDEAVVARTAKVRTLCAPTFAALVDGAPYVTKRGFVDEVTLTVGAFARRATSLLAVQPIRSFRVEVDSQKDLERLAKIPVPWSVAIRLRMRRAPALALDAAELAPLFDRVALDLEGVSAEPEQWCALLASCVRVRDVRLATCRVVEASVLASLATLADLRSLELDRLGALGVVPSNDQLAALRTLGARLTRIGGLDWLDPEGFRRAYTALLADSNLVEIDGLRASWGGVLAEVLASSPRTRRLEKLAIHIEEADELAALLTADLASLRELRVLPRASAERIPQFADILAAHARPELRIDWHLSPELCRK